MAAPDEPAVPRPRVVALGGAADFREAELDELGGKGAWLARLVQHGFPVPPTAVVTTGAYRSLVNHPSIGALLRRITTGEVVGAEEVDATFLAAPLPAPLASQMLATARRIGTDAGLAVRSSASAEDMAGHSFAGQYRSFLGVDSGRDEQVLEAIRLTWASLWHPAPCAYRREWRVPEEGIAMAVVLMAMVPARTAGVVFTSDPIGPPDTLRVEAVRGLGEGLVSGAITPEVWVVDRAAGSAVPTGAPPYVAEVVRLARQVEAAFGQPQDVEWAWDGRRVWLVQARPITTPAVTGTSRGDGADTELDEAELTTAGIDEMLPGVIRPLVWDVASYLVEEALRGVFDSLGAEMPERGPQGFVRRVRARAALDLDRLKAVALSLPGGSASDIERDYFGVEPAPTDDDRPVPAGPFRRWSHALRVAAARHQAMNDAEIAVAATDELLESPLRLEHLADGAVLAYRSRLLDMASRAMRAELAVAAAATARYGELVTRLVGHLGRTEAEREAQRITTGSGVVISPADASRTIFAGPTWAEAGLDPATGTADPGVSSSAAAQEALADLQDRLCSTPRWRRTRILSGQVVDVRWHVIQRLAADAADGLARRERTKLAVLRLGGEMRRIHLELGRRLHQRGVLDDALDIDLLRETELRPALAGRAPKAAELNRRRRWVARQEHQEPLPLRFRGDPAPVGPASDPRSTRLEGWAGSPGRYSGRAVALREADPQALPDGAVLVARATDASWSPVFVRAGAVVVERGGPLSHAAIVARELGLPAVLNVPGASEVLDSHWVTVDGDLGQVLLHDGDHQSLDEDRSR